MAWNQRRQRRFKDTEGALLRNRLQLQRHQRNADEAAGTVAVFVAGWFLGGCLFSFTGTAVVSAGGLFG